jgi:hypothetical protein
MQSNMEPYQSTVKTNPSPGSGPAGPKKGAPTMFDQIAATLAVAAMIILPFVFLAIAAVRYGADSRPGIDDRDQRPWLVPGH